jgi:hypothetical protein
MKHRQENFEFEASLACIAKSCLKKTMHKTKKKKTNYMGSVCMCMLKIEWSVVVADITLRN